MISSRSKERAHNALREASVAFLEDEGLAHAVSNLDEHIHLIDDKTRGGYGLFGQDVLECITEQLSCNGFSLDPIYTGKAFLGMQEYVEENGITGENILFVHTGGEPIFYDNLQAGAFSQTSL